MLALADSAGGKRALCPNCSIEFRVPSAPLAEGGTAEPAATAEPVLPAGANIASGSLIRCPACDRTLAIDPSLPGSIPGMQTGTNYALPGAFLAILGAIGVIVFAFSLLGAFIGIFGQQPPRGSDEFIFTVLWSATSIAFQLLTFIGGVQMIRRRQLGWAKLGTFAALYPCGSCVLVQLPIAIWALVILTREIAVYDFASPMQRHDLQSLR